MAEMWRNKSFVIAVIGLLASACSGQGHDALPIAPEATLPETSAGLPSGLASPDSILALRPPRVPSEALLIHPGSDFELAQRATAQGPDALLAPQWSGDGSMIGDAAYAVYRFNEEGYNGQQTLKFTWTAPPPDYSKLWLGLSHFDLIGFGRWKWRRLPENNFIDFGPDGLLPYTNGDTGDVLLTVMLLGTDTASLSQVELGGTMLGDWSMGGHDAQRSGLSPHVGPQTNHLKWALNMGGDVRANPVIAADGTIYIGTVHTDEPSYFFAINPDGTVKWSMQTVDCINGAAAIAPDGTVYVPTGTPIASGTRGILYALNPDGTEKWTLPIGTTNSLLLAPNGVIYVVTSYYESGLKSTLTAVNPDGTVQWETERMDKATAPALSANGTVYIGSFDKNLYAFNADGTQQWSCALGGGYSYPVVSSNGEIYTTSSYALYKIDINGVIQWPYETSMNAAAVSLGPDGTLYLANGNGAGLHAIRPDGTQKWSFPLLGWTMWDKAAVGADGTVYVSCKAHSNSALLAFKSDGTLLWVYGSLQHIYSPAIGNDGTLYVGSDNDYLYAFGP